MRTLLIDNYDSFTYNLYQLISMVNGTTPTVLHNDENLDLAGLGTHFDNVIVSPGPGRPDRALDVGVSAAVIRESSLPLLGVCLGHQTLIVTAGGTVDSAPQARHGYLDRVRHDGAGLFAGIPQRFTAVRYHSLCAVGPLPEQLAVTAQADDDVIMGVRHRERPQWGVQFHPESVASEYGRALLENFSSLTAAEQLRRVREVVRLSGTPRRALSQPHTPVAEVPETAHSHSPTVSSEMGEGSTARSRQKVFQPNTFRLHHEVIDRPIDTERAFLQLYAESPTAFWLDSEHVEPGLDRFSFLGDARGPLAEVVRYRAGDGRVTVTNASGAQRTVEGDVLSYLQTRIAEIVVEKPELPFDFACGYVGYLGYEVKADCGAPSTHRADTPDAQWIFADRLVVVDHVGARTHLLALTETNPEAFRTGTAWIRQTRTELETLPTWSNPAPLAADHDPVVVEPLLTRGRERYLRDIESSKRALLAGESYEICLTDSLTLPAAPDDGLDFYRALRRCNPAPYAAYLRFDGLDIACSSPERFLKIDRHGTVESKPIKGTAPRGRTPAEDELLRARLVADPKTRAENLMIVDLLRNDLGRVCEVGSVHVPKLMATETYSTLHQLVSTVRGTLRPDASALDCVRACFPGGSMTGAPKLRTMAIIDELETRARGVYSGTIGFLGLGGTADLNIVIRTAVCYAQTWHIGAGGAIVLDSDAEAEFQEMVLKAAATLRAASVEAPR